MPCWAVSILRLETSCASLSLPLVTYDAEDPAIHCLPHPAPSQSSKFRAPPVDNGLSPEISVGKCESQDRQPRFLALEMQALSNTLLSIAGAPHNGPADISGSSLEPSKRGQGFEDRRRFGLLSSMHAILEIMGMNLPTFNLFPLCSKENNQRFLPRFEKGRWRLERTLNKAPVGCMLEVGAISHLQRKCYY